MWVLSFLGCVVLCLCSQSAPSASASTCHTSLASTTSRFSPSATTAARCCGVYCDRGSSVKVRHSHQEAPPPAQARFCSAERGFKVPACASVCVCAGPQCARSTCTGAARRMWLPTVALTLAASPKCSLTLASHRTRSSTVLRGGKRWVSLWLPLLEFLSTLLFSPAFQFPLGDLCQICKNSKSRNKTKRNWR